MLINVGFTGTRAGCTTVQKAALEDVLRDLRQQGAIWMHNGDAIGCDLEAALLWFGSGGRVFLRPCTHKDRAGFQLYNAIVNPKPPLDRNKDIVDVSEVLVACSATMEETPRGGTWSTVRYAGKKRRPTIIVYPDGSVERRNEPETQAIL